MNRSKIAIAGGGAAGFFAAITAAESNPQAAVTIFERSSQFLSKVRISGGGRCNVTHALFDPREFSTRYPRGTKALISPFHRFSAADTVAWFEAQGVALKTEGDGRMFPVTDSSQTIVACLIDAAKATGVRLLSRVGIEKARVREGGGFELQLSDGGKEDCDLLLLATGGTRNHVGAQLAKSLGHSLEPAVPSLFSLHARDTWLRSLPGVSVADAEVSFERLRQRGPLLITHNGVSGPAVLKLSAWGARILAQVEYRFALRISWTPEHSETALYDLFQRQRKEHPKRAVVHSAMLGVPSRLWQALAQNAGISAGTLWNTVTRSQMRSLTTQLRATKLSVDGKSLNKDEFVTCGGVKLSEVNFKTMESRVTPGLYFAGELLDIDGITGGFNFQAAWSTGWIAGGAMAGVESRPK